MVMQLLITVVLAFSAGCGNSTPDISSTGNQMVQKTRNSSSDKKKQDKSSEKSKQCQADDRQAEELNGKIKKLSLDVKKLAEKLGRTELEKTEAISLKEDLEQFSRELESKMKTEKKNFETQIVIANDTILEQEEEMRALNNTIGIVTRDRDRARRQVAQQANTIRSLQAEIRRLRAQQ